MNFPEYDPLDGRERVRVFGKLVFLTDSGAVEFMDQNQRELLPLVSGGGPLQLPAGSAWFIPVECDGYFVIAAGSRYTVQQLGNYEAPYFGDVPRKVDFWQPVPPVYASISNVDMVDVAGATNNLFKYRFTFDAGTVGKTLYTTPTVFEYYPFGLDEKSDRNAVTGVKNHAYALAMALQYLTYADLVASNIATLPGIKVS